MATNSNLSRRHPFVKRQSTNSAAQGEDLGGGPLASSCLSISAVSLQHLRLRHSLQNRARRLEEG